MGLLRSRAWAAWAAAAGLCACAGCMLVDALSVGEKGLAFSHELHVTDEGLACVTCHESAEVEEAPGMPARDSCAVCHDQLDEEKPAERTVASLFGEQGFRAARAGRLAEEVRFEHLAHVGAIRDCARCHRGIETDRAIDSGDALLMEDCMACHAERSLPNECADCHREIGPDWAPPNHTFDWTKLHGRACRRNDPRPAEDCSLCHSDSSCEECHRLEPPASHDSYFRLRGHSLIASIDRDGCATCHEPASCDRCHEEVLPLTHASSLWGNTRNTHCLTCHFPLQGEGCLTCHKGTPSHALGTPKPSWHDAAMNCRSCHGLSLPLSHVDDGSNCNLCHP